MSSPRTDRKFYRNFFAASPTLPNSIVFSISLDLLRWVHMNHAVVANSSTTLDFDNNLSTKSSHDPCVASNRFTQLKSLHHTAFTASQSHRACFVSSATLPQRWHVRSVRIFLFIKFAFVGKLSEQAFHLKVFNFSRHFEFPHPIPQTWNNTSIRTQGSFHF